MTDIDGIINKSAMPEESIKKLPEHLENIRRTMKAVRRLSHELRPGVLDRFGLIPSIEMLVQEVQKEDLLNCKLRITGKTRRLLPEAEVAMFRVAQEALRNVRRHSMAKRCEIKLSFVNKETFLSIADDGKGFNLPNLLSSFARKGKLGILGMYERARLLDGEFMIETGLGKGTTVTMRVPISLSSRHSERNEQ
jgi:signal transduction histidine kinase